MEGLAEAHGEEPFAMHILKTQPDMDRKAIRRKRNQYWNAFKHFSDRKDFAREDEELLAQFSDINNDVALFREGLGPRARPCASQSLEGRERLRAGP